MLTITISIALLVALNFLLLIFSSNKTTKQTKTNTKPVVLKPNLAFKHNETTLAPTGS